MNKMTETAIHAVLDGVKEGDVLRAVFEGEAGEDKRYPNWLAIADRTLRYQDRTFNEALISIENLGQPEKPEPEVGSFALLDIGVLARAQHHEQPTRTEVRWHYFGDTSACYSWNEIKPNIKTLYNPDGSVKEGWNK